MTASPSMDFPTYAPYSGHPSPTANGVRANLRIGSRVLSLDISWVYVRKKYIRQLYWPYRTVLACNSIGAPDSTAAGKTSPSSLPFITRLGTGVNSLFLVRYCCFRTSERRTMMLGQLLPDSLADCDGPEYP